MEARTNKGARPMQIAESLNYSGIKRVLIQGGANKDEFTTAPAFENIIIKGRRAEKDTGLKKKNTRGKSLCGSFDQSAAHMVAI